MLSVNTFHPRLPETSAASPRSGRPHRGPLGRCEPAQVDAADDQREHREHGPDPRQRPPPFGHRHGRARAARLRMAPHVQRDGHHVARRREQPRHDGGEEQLGDVLLGQDRVDHEDDRRREEDAEGAAGGKGRGGEAAGVALPPKLGQNATLAHRRRGGERGAADRAEPRAGTDGGHRHPPPRRCPHPAFRGTKQRCRHARQGRELPHQQEHRNDRQRVAGEGRVGLALEAGEEDVRPAEREVQPAEPAEQHREPHRCAQEDQQQQHREGEEAERQRAHRSVFAPSASTPRSVSPFVPPGGAPPSRPAVTATARAAAQCKATRTAPQAATKLAP